MDWKWKRFLIWFGHLWSLVSGVIGLAGISDDLKTWYEWLIMLDYLDQDYVRTLLVESSVIILPIW